MSYARIQLNADGSEHGTPKPSIEYYTENAQGQRGGGFLSQEALAAAVSDSRYGVDRDYTRAVQQAIGQTNMVRNGDSTVTFGGPSAEEQRRGAAAVSACEVVTDQITSLMSDPRYQTSPNYRAYVAECIANSQNAAWVAHRPVGDASGCTRVVMANDATVKPLDKPSPNEDWDSGQ